MLRQKAIFILLFTKQDKVNFFFKLLIKNKKLLERDKTLKRTSLNGYDLGEINLRGAKINK